MSLILITSSNNSEIKSCNKLVSRKDFIERNPLKVTPNTPLKFAIDLMQKGNTFEAKSSVVLVVKEPESELLGLLTERDIVKLTAMKTRITQTQIAQVMTREIITILESELQDLSFALEIFSKYQIRHLPIVDRENRLVGLVTPYTIRQALRPLDLLKLRIVADVMNTNVVWSTGDSSIQDLAELMVEKKVSCVVIVDKNNQNELKPVGIVSESDIVQFQALKLNFKTLTTAQVMSHPLFCISSMDSLWEANHQMHKLKIRRLVVINSKSGEMEGIITQSSLLATINPLEMNKVLKVLQHKVSQLETEKIQLLEMRNLELEREVQERTARNQEMIQLSKISHFLQSCSTVSEAYQGLSALIAPLFQQTIGAIVFEAKNENLKENIISWGEITSSKILEIIRHLPKQQYNFNQDNYDYSVCEINTKNEYFCFSIVSQQKNVISLYLRSSNSELFDRSKRLLAKTLAEQISLGLSC